MATPRIRFLLVADSPGHTTGYYVVARALREAGVEVILGGHAQPEQIVETAIQEDADWIGYRIMDREPPVVVSRLMQLLTERDQPQVRVVVGGIVARGDVARLQQLGVEAVFRPGASLDDIVAAVFRNDHRRESPGGPARD
jgi:methylmalonyl-CoA mutase cobalamin-binding domain/chain